ncbi:hypothetical protein [Streptomyces sp. CB00455]|uniref:hypothetical protein n=1 Tax=Streptomyces sp. CB00455 TaxID=1703927 RepID=UPI000A5C279A|nr:hypothetical protein [Streptomyces sp. CB00455]
MQRRVSVAIAVASVLGLSGVAAQGAMATSAASAPRAAVAATPQAAQDGRALFEGLAFAQGSVAEDLGESGKFADLATLRQSNSTPEQRQAASALLDKVQANQPQFFAGFSGKLRSGDPRKVQDGIKEAAGVLKSLSDQAPPVKPGDTGTGTGQCATVVLAVNVLVAVNLGGAVNVSVAVNIQAAANVANAVNFWWSPPSGSGSLSADEQIAELTQVLAA